jgi:transposase
MLQPVRRRTWAPRGQTPIHRAWDRRDRLSVIGIVTVSPRRHRLGEYFRILPRNVEADDLVWFVEQLHRHLPRTIILVWDRSGPHRRAAALLLAKHADWLTIEWLPPYAPELNPEEQCWKHTKYDDLANFIPDDVDALYEAVGTSISDQKRNPLLLRSYFEYAKLKL